MRSFVRSSFAWMGLSAVMIPVTASAQAVAPAGYAASSSPTMMIGMDGKPVAVQPVAAVAGQAAPAPNQMMVPAQAAAPHKHRLRSVCASCMKKQQAMPVERIVACAHSKNGVCPTCQALLAMPGAVTVGAPAPAPTGEAPGRAVVSNTPTPTMAPGAAQYAAQSGPVSAVYDPSQMPGPTPIGVMQANFAQPGAMAGAMPAAPSSVPTASSLQPGHAVAEAGNTPAPFMRKSTSSNNPMIITHLLGFRNYAADWREQHNNKKNQAHASIPYNNDGTTINELPASVVYGRQH